MKILEKSEETPTLRLWMLIIKMDMSVFAWGLAQRKGEGVPATTNMGGMKNQIRGRLSNLSVALKDGNDYVRDSKIKKVVSMDILRDSHNSMASEQVARRIAENMNIQAFVSIDYSSGEDDDAGSAIQVALYRFVREVMNGEEST